MGVRRARLRSLFALRAFTVTRDYRRPVPLNTYCHITGGPPRGGSTGWAACGGLCEAAYATTFCGGSADWSGRSAGRLSSQHATPSMQYIAGSEAALLQCAAGRGTDPVHGRAG
jgi:hypothetical protein